MKHDQLYWDNKMASILDYYRYWGSREVPVTVIPELTAQDAIKKQEECAGVAIDHPTFGKRMREYEEQLRRKRLSELSDLVPA
ncbi:MAG: hypothetical protein HYV35_12570 [Lentisphaerae bacterium]|nr:hypothetical protein [Lentisphaerota bacterium]